MGRTRMCKVGWALVVVSACSGGTAHGEGGVVELLPPTSGLVLRSFGDCSGGEIYDDGTAEFGFGVSTDFSSFQVVQVFSPATNPGSYNTACIALHSSAGPELDFQIQVWDDDGPGGEPGTLLGSMAATATGLPDSPPCAFRAYDISSLGLSIPGGNVWIGVQWNPQEFPWRFICADASLTTPQHPVLENRNTGDGWQPPVAVQTRALLVRASEEAHADLGIVKEGEIAGTQVTYSLTVTNHGPAQATGVLVTDALPGELTYVSDDCGGSEGPPWTWALSPLADGASEVCNLVATVDSQFLGDFSNTATVTGDQVDTIPGNDSDTVRLAATGPSVLEVPVLGSAARVLLALLLSAGAVLALRRGAL